MPCRSPQNYPWVSAVLDKGYQVCELRSDLKSPTHVGYKILFLDQRGMYLTLFSPSLTMFEVVDRVCGQRDGAE